MKRSALPPLLPLALVAVFAASAGLILVMPMFRGLLVLLGLLSFARLIAWVEEDAKQARSV